MKIKLVSIAMILALSAGFNAHAVSTEDGAKNIEKSEFKRGHKMKFRNNSVVLEYMLEQGDITQGEIDLQKLERKATREELKTLKEAGDTEGLAAKKAELKAKYKERREAMKKYIDENEELKTRLEEKRKEYRQKKKERRKERKEKRQERNSESTEG